MTIYFMSPGTLTLGSNRRVPHFDWQILSWQKCPALLGRNNHMSYDKKKNLKKNTVSELTA